MLTGTKLGRYEIRQKIGAGGMGEVYLAHDEQLDRNVALKVLLPEFCCDAERVHRFKLEAKAASALNHPNIITIYEINEHDDRLYIATEFVTGETIRERIEKGELSHVEAVKIAEQVADALAVAHEAGIIHRDIKPENIMIRRDGYVKILDFGLAKPIFPQKVGAEDETARWVKTQPGMVIGSVRYMSPEQARGRETDERTDVWSLGVVLYEMLTGDNPFEGETVSDSLAALIHVEPVPVPHVPEELQRILRKALKKKADERYQSIKDFALDLRDLRLESEHALTEQRLSAISQTKGLKKYDTSENATLIQHTISAETETRRQGSGWSKTQDEIRESRWRWWPVGAAALGVILALGGWFTLASLFAGSVPVFQSIQASRLTESGTANLAEISPDGRFVSFVNRQEGRASLVVRQIATASSVTVVQPSLLELYQPSFTPDGEHIYYVSVEKGVGTLFQIPTLGGEAKKIIVDVDSKVTFSPDGKRLAFVRHNPLEGGDTIVIADSDGRNPENFVQTKEVGYDGFSSIDWSPDGERMLVGAFNNTGDPNQRLKILTVGLKDKQPEFVGERGWLGVKSLEWMKDGRGIVLVGKANQGENSQVWHLGYPAGTTRQITTDTSDYGSVSVSADGASLVATRVDMISSFWSFNPQTREMKPLTSENKNLIGMAGISQMPDGRILFVKNTGKSVDIFSMDETGSDEKQLTSNSGNNQSPVATADGKYIVFISNRQGSFSVWRMNADGTGPVQLTRAENAIDSQVQVSRDGRQVIFMRQTSDGGRTKLMRVPIDGGEPVPLLPESDLAEFHPRISFDGRKIAFHSFHFNSQNPTFDSRIRVFGFDGEKIDKNVKEFELKIHPEFKFSPDSKLLTYINKSGIDNLWSVGLDDGREQPLTDFASGNISNFLWSADGKKLFIVRAIYNSDLVLIRDNSKS